ncbi:DUF1651 domain-containing protein [Synechococcus sp. CS-1333]|uniref:DUF1651 domain-containing protein n=1 Tax=Synechococcus sp. CS-1333 TaxID=2848638 RepID=UPI00223B7652|nr:DUF1651 domain-containing protein [Synechococcus sp. CS-1333]
MTPQEGWLSDGRQVLRFRPTRWERDYHRLEITAGELLPDQEVPLLITRRELSRAETLMFWWVNLPRPPRLQWI